MPMVVYCNAVVNPGTVTAPISAVRVKTFEYSLVMLSYTSTASLAVFAPKRSPQQACRAKILVIELPKTQKLINDRLLLASTSELRNISRILEHRECVEVCAE